MESKKFIKVYNSLNNHHKQIVFQTLLMMDRKLKHTSPKEAIHGRIKEKQNKLDIKYAKLKRKLEESAQEREMKLTKQTYESVLRRKSIKGETFDDICEILQISKDELKDIRRSVHLGDQVSIEWLFNSLSPKNRNAIFALVNLLYMEETSPEYFDPYFIDDE